MDTNHAEKSRCCVSQAQASSSGNTIATVDLLIKNGRVDTGEDTKEQFVMRLFAVFTLQADIGLLQLR
ncbi:hypothetical protein AADZ84_06775 [Colwelliaceae bacterium MEBiC 14330]